MAVSEVRIHSLFITRMTISEELNLAIYHATAIIILEARFYVNDSFQTVIKFS